jgi:hypothetical protein
MERSHTDPRPEASGIANHVRSVSRRGFLTAASAGAAGIGVLAAAGPAVTNLVTDSEDASPAEVPAALTAEPVVAQIRDVASGEISIMSGMQEVVVKDPQLVMRLLRSVGH